MCSCGELLGFEELEEVESPACIVSAVATRFPRLPTVVYLDTACQTAQNATRRMPWLVRNSRTTWALDRLDAAAHKCSPIFDANMYPKRTSGHKTSAAESRHSFNKPMKTHLFYLGQDRFFVQMRLHGAFNNLRVLYRESLGSRNMQSTQDLRRRALTPFLREYVSQHCQLYVCACRVPVERRAPVAAPASNSSSCTSSESSS